MSTSTSLFTKSPLDHFVDLGVDEKCLLINIFWPHLNLAKDDYIPEIYAAFFEFIDRTLRGLQPHACAFAAQDLASLLDIVTTLQIERASLRKAIVTKIKPNYLNYQTVDIARCIELSLRLWLGINANSKGISVGPINSRDTRIEWSDDLSLDDLIADQFGTPTVKNVAFDLPLEGSFTAVNLKNICRLHIRWTDNLTDHLKLEGARGQRSLSVYRHKICLINHRKAPAPTMLPIEILDEAIRSLDLLFPFSDSKTEEFLESEQVQLHTADPFRLPRATELDDFKYWRTNIAQLLNLLNGPPETVAQTLLDTRNLPQFATIWVAIFGVFCLTILFGCLSTVYAVKQYVLALKSYDLSIAVACAQLADSLPQYCG